MKSTPYFLTIFLYLLVSCDNKPSEKEIKEAISKVVVFPVEKIEPLHLYYPSKFDTGQARKFHENLLNNGLIFKPEIVPSTNEYYKDETHIVLTPLGSKYIGKKYNYNDDSSSVMVAIGTEQFSKIDSVVMGRDKKSVEVFGTTKLIDLTPFGQIFPEFKKNMEIPYRFEMEKQNGIWEIVYHH